jgi:toxin ParE1/3/4
MTDYRLSPEAEGDLDRIYDFGIDRFGLEQANKYLDAIEQRFGEIAQSPLTYPAVDYIRVGYRRSVCGSHSIYYRLNDSLVEIMRIIGEEKF